MTAPFPISSSRNESGADGVEHDVPADFQQIGVPFYQRREEASLENVSGARMTPIEALTVVQAKIRDLTPYGNSRVEPEVRRDSRSAWARAASASA